ncbi:tyrosine-type recombinase/integrase [Bifidobacterium olomucense]|uniref:Phage-related integrase n=1 Tax=Bifidobacterium olomucense TaxID=2675324 RepID=A0A7Y0EXA3_9BIFI|nr:tyrosine-type recombinase/integrase [Bifidobacterium sp. DSM 109959]NMM98079.1 phage-related integrase [Bifidobacterium sp. DSM 109959]
MPRQKRNGAIYPIKQTYRKLLSDGKERQYVRWKAKVGDTWVSGKTYEECDEKIKQALRNRNEWGVSLDRSISLGEYADQWFEMKKRTIDPNSIDLYKSLMKRHLAKYRDTPLADVTPSMLQRLLSNMRNIDGTESSLSRRQSMYNVLRQIFQAATADRIIPTNPVTTAIRPKQRDEKLSVKGRRRAALPSPDDSAKKDGRTGVQNRQAYTPEEMMRMLQASTDDIFTGARQWWRLLTGMRQGEVLGITLDDLELWEKPGANGVYVGQYTVNWQLSELNRMHGCGESDGRGVYPCGQKRPMLCPDAQWVVPDDFDMIHLYKRFALTPPKAQRGSVKPLIPELGTVIHRYLEATKDVPNPYGLLFRTEKGLPIDANDDRRGFRELMRKADIPDYQHRYVHECRNSVASLLFKMGVDPGIIQRILGHSSIEMSEHYRTVPIEDLLSGMETIGEKLDLKQIEWRDTTKAPAGA